MFILVNVSETLYLINKIHGHSYFVKYKIF